LEDGTTDGAISASGTVMGSYLHGLFASADLRRALLDRIGVAASGRDYHADVDTELYEMAAALALGSETSRDTVWTHMVLLGAAGSINKKQTTNLTFIMS